MFTRARNFVVHDGDFRVTEHNYYSDPGKRYALILPNQYPERKSAITKLYHASALGALYGSQDHLPLPEILDAQTEIIQRAWKWFSSQESKPLLWLYSPSTAVKSAAARVLVEKAKKQFAASFFFTPLRDNCSSAERFVPTIAVQLVEHIPGFYDSLIRSMHVDPFVLERSSLETQVDQLILEPLREVTARGPFLIIIDALDKCASEEDRHEILTQISRIVLAHRDLIRFAVLTSERGRLFNEPEIGSIVCPLTIPDGTILERGTSGEKMDFSKREGGEKGFSLVPITSGNIKYALQCNHIYFPGLNRLL
ncbi:hypothetical protein C0992_006507 [Termitomyces sp. T32_za158]|nr:hypothetical protein C0992_006507 [Termitomyces sp. T32_za158]